MTLALHIGLPKTASTHLQKHVFPTFLSDCQYAFGEDAKRMLRTGSIPKEQTLLLSAEAWSNSLWGGGYTNNFHRFLSQVEKLRRDDIKILFFIRDHEEWLISAYLQLAKAAFFKPRTFSKFITMFDQADISWAQRISDLNDYPIFVCRYEDFFKQPDIWTDKMADFIGLERYERDCLDNVSSRINLTPKTAISLALVRSVTVTTEFPDMVLKKMTGQRVLFGGNGRADFIRVWLRDKLITLADGIPGLLPIKDRFLNEIPRDMRSFFSDDIEKCREYIES